jgi:hypothetical protein
VGRRAQRRRLHAAVIAACRGRYPAARPRRQPAGSVDYRIDATRSELRVLVYRGGSLAALGHNHVIVDSAISGWVRSGEALRDSSFHLQLAPADFAIDPPAARAQEGADFADEVADEARAGTRRNLLSGAQLDADSFPLILVESVSVQGAGNAATATFRITIAGPDAPRDEPFTFERNGHRAAGACGLPAAAVGARP